MIQRIQSVYLLLVTALLTTNIFLPGAGLNYTPWGQLAILILGALVSFATIFLFKNRKLQIRMCIFNMLIMTGYYIVFLLFVLMAKSNIQAPFQFSFGLCLPLIAMILNYLAIRAIRKDEDKVRAADRIR